MSILILTNTVCLTFENGRIKWKFIGHIDVIQVFTIVLMRMHVFAWDRGKGMNLLYDFMRICLQCLSFSCLQQPGDKIIELIHFTLFFLLYYDVLYFCNHTMMCCIFVIVLWCVVFLLSYYDVLYFCYHTMICRIFVLILWRVAFLLAYYDMQNFLNHTMMCCIFFYHSMMCCIFVILWYAEFL